MSVDTAAERRHEQAYFDQALEDHEASFRPATTAASLGTNTERSAMKKHQESKIHLGQNEPVAFKRYMLENGESYYIGKVSIRDDEMNVKVINWQSSVATKLIQSTVQEPNGVSVCRSFSTTGNRIDQFNDAVYQDLAEKVSTLEDELRADPILKSSLDATRTGQMRDIVQTIQASQDRLIRAEKDQLLIIQGGPGTGKTAVALHRASWLLYTYPEQLPADDILVVGPNPSFTKYIRNVLPALGNQKVKQMSVLGLITLPGVPIRNIEQEDVARIKGDAIMARVIRQGLIGRIKKPTAAIRIRKLNSGSHFVIEPHLLQKDIESLVVGSYAQGREKLRARLLEECGKQLLTPSGARNVQYTVDPRSLENALERILPSISAQQFIRDLLSSRARLDTAGRGLLTLQQQQMLFRRSQGAMSKEMWTLSDMTLIDEADYQMNFVPRRWGHIIVDEAQDLTPMQLRAIRRRSKNGSMTVVGDLAQSTGPFARDSWDDVSAVLKTHIPVKIEHLKHGYRVPKEVYDIAALLLPQAAKNIEPASIIRATGLKPRLFTVVPSQINQEIARQAQHHKSKGRFIGVIAPEEQFDDIRQAFNQQHVRFTDSSTGELSTSINLVSPEMSKGLEFDAIIVVDPQAILETDEKWGARLLYIALTRTTRLLDVIAPTGEVPQFLLGDRFESIAIDRADEETADRAINLPEAAKSATVLERASESVQSTQDDDKKPEPSTAVAKSSEFTAAQQELINHTANFYYDVFRTSFTPEMSQAVLETTLRLFNSKETEQ